MKKSLKNYLLSSTILVAFVGLTVSCSKDSTNSNLPTGVDIQQGFSAARGGKGGGGGKPCAAVNVTAFSPGLGEVGDTVIITGSGFSRKQGSGTVEFNGTPVTKYNSWSKTSLSVDVPNGASTGSIKVTSSCGSIFTTSSIFTFPVPGTPVELRFEITGSQPPTGFSTSGFVRDNNANEFIFSFIQGDPTLPFVTIYTDTPTGPLGSSINFQGTVYDVASFTVTLYTNGSLWLQSMSTTRSFDGTNVTQAYLNGTLLP